jgi:hypothetical protein
MTVDERVENLIRPWLTSFQPHQRSLLRVLVRKAFELETQAEEQLRQLGEFEGRRGRS